MFRSVMFVLFCYSMSSAQTIDDTIAYSIMMNDYVITAQHEPTHHTKALHKIDVIKKESFAKTGAVTLDQVLLVIPSIRLTNDPILGTSIKMRGVGAQDVAILIDGVPTIGRNNGAIDISQISILNVERIEVVQGPLSNIYGSNAAGGVINIITKKSQINKWSLQQSNQLESINQRNHIVSLGYQKNRITIRTNARYFKYDQYPSDSLRIIDAEIQDDGTTNSLTRYPYNPKTQQSIGGFIRYQLSDNHHIIAKYDYNKENVIDYGIIKRAQFNPYALDQFYRTSREDLSLSYKGQFADNFFINTTGSSNVYNRIRDDKRYYLESMTFDNLQQISDSISFDQVFYRSDITYTGIDSWVISAGINYTNEKSKGDRISSTITTESSDTYFTESALYTDLKYNGFQNLHLSLGSRWIHHNLYSNAMTSSFQLKYDISPKVTLRSSIAQGYRSPSLKELHLEFIDINHHIIGNTDLKPERSYDIQSTLSYTPTKNIDFSFNAYATAISDQISLTEYETLKFQYRNISEYNVFGFQPSINFQFENFTSKTGFSLGYWSSNIENKDAPQFGKQFDCTTSMNYLWNKAATTFTLNHRYTGTQPVFRLQNDIVEIGYNESFHLIDSSLSRSFLNDKLKFVLGCRNITNTTFTNSINSDTGSHSSVGRNSISIGRSWFISVGIHL